MSRLCERLAKSNGRREALDYVLVRFLHDGFRGIYEQRCEM